MLLTQGHLCNGSCKYDWTHKCSECTKRNICGRGLDNGSVDASSAASRQWRSWEHGWGIHWRRWWRASAQAQTRPSDRGLDLNCFNCFVGQASIAEGVEKSTSCYNAIVLAEILEEKLINPLQIKIWCHQRKWKSYVVKCGWRSRSLRYSAGRMHSLQMRDIDILTLSERFLNASMRQVALWQSLITSMTELVKCHGNKIYEEPGREHNTIFREW